MRSNLSFLRKWDQNDKNVWFGEWLANKKSKVRQGQNLPIHRFDFVGSDEYFGILRVNSQKILISRTKLFHLYRLLGPRADKIDRQYLKTYFLVQYTHRIFKFLSHYALWVIAPRTWLRRGQVWLRRINI